MGLQIVISQQASEERYAAAERKTRTLTLG